MHGWIHAIDFPEDWVDLRSSQARQAMSDVVLSHRRELMKEISRGHVLHGYEWEIVAIRAPARDDVLLLLDDDTVALVHVTWRGAPEPTEWPMTVICGSVDELRAELEDRGYSCE